MGTPGILVLFGDEEGRVRWHYLKLKQTLYGHKCLGYYHYLFVDSPLNMLNLKWNIWNVMPGKKLWGGEKGVILCSQSANKAPLPLMVSSFPPERKDLLVILLMKLTRMLAFSHFHGQVCSPFPWNDSSIVAPVG